MCDVKINKKEKFSFVRKSKHARQTETRSRT
nr:MAG TPA: hypothetical protein [Caudoviricetes sp.]